MFNISASHSSSYIDMPNHRAPTVAQYRCSTCGLLFDSIREELVHSYSHRTIFRTMVYRGVMLEFKILDGKHVVCRCGLTFPISFMRNHHARVCKPCIVEARRALSKSTTGVAATQAVEPQISNGKWITYNGPTNLLASSPTASSTSASLHASSPLDAVGFYIDQSSNLLICSLCKTTVVCPDIRSHFAWCVANLESRRYDVPTSQQQMSAVKYLEAVPHAVCSFKAASEWLDAHKGMSIARIPHLPVFIVDKCQKCGYLVGPFNSMPAHYAALHPELPVPEGQALVRAHRPFRQNPLKTFIQIADDRVAKPQACFSGQNLSPADSAAIKTPLVMDGENFSFVAEILGWSQLLEPALFQELAPLTRWTDCSDRSWRHIFERLVECDINEAYIAGSELAVSGRIRESKFLLDAWFAIKPHERELVDSGARIYMLLLRACEECRFWVLLGITTEQVEAALKLKQLLEKSCNEDASNLTSELVSLFKDLNIAMLMYSLPAGFSWNSHFIIRALGLLAWSGNHPFDPMAISKCVSRVAVWSRIALYQAHQPVMDMEGHQRALLAIQLSHTNLLSENQTPYGAMSKAECVLKWAAICDPSSGIIQWTPNSSFTQMTYIRQHVRMDEISRIYTCIITHLEEVLADILGDCSTDLTSISVANSIADDTSDYTNSRSFLRHTDNGFVKHAHQLFGNMVEKGVFLKVNAAQPDAWDRNSMVRWQQRVSEFVDYLITALCIVSHALVLPCDLADLRLQSRLCQPRSVFAVNNTIKLVSWHDSGTSLLLHARLADVLLRYCVLVRPCEQSVAIILAESEQQRAAHALNYHDLLLVKEGRSIGEDDIRSIFASVWAKESSCGLSLSDYQRISGTFAIALLHRGMSASAITRVCTLTVVGYQKSTAADKIQAPATVIHLQDCGHSQLWADLLESVQRTSSNHHE